MGNKYLEDSQAMVGTVSRDRCSVLRRKDTGRPSVDADTVGMVREASERSPW
jgi:hypothetical protein